MAKKLALFVDVDNLHQQLRALHHRSLDPALLLEAARKEGELIQSLALADWTDLPDEVATACVAAGLAKVQVERVTRSRETGGRRREFVRDLVDLEILAQMVELLFADGRPEVDGFLLASCDESAARVASLIRARFQKDVIVLGVEGAVGPALQAAATRTELLPLPAVEPRDPQLLANLVPLLEGLERKKRYLNFKYIRETIVRRLELPERSFDAAERLLSEAIACGLLAKLKIEDKYNPGQLFTAYALNRESEWFKKWGSGEPAPLHDESSGAETQEIAGEVRVDDRIAEAEPPAPREAEAPARAAPSFARPAARAKEERRGPPPAPAQQRPPRPPEPPPPPPGEEDEGYDDGPNRDQRDGDARRGGAGGRRRRRGRGGRDGQQGANDGPPIPLSAGSGGRRPGRNPQLDRVGRAYEAPSRFIQEETNSSSLHDDDIDEDRILRARGD